MLEKRLHAVSPQMFTANGTVAGLITVAANACALFKVKQRVLIKATGLPTLELEIKEIDSEENIYVGPYSSPGNPANINSRTDISAYTVVLGANISAFEQKRPAIDYAESMRAVYDEEPTVALRTVMVDECGDRINGSNPLPVSIDGTIAVGDVSIVEGGNTLEVNTDGSINVNIVDSIPTSTPGLDLRYNEISSVPSGVETNLITLTASSIGFRVEKIIVSGENIALFKVYVNSAPIAVKRTFFGDLNQEFNFENFNNGLRLNVGDTMLVTVLHTRPSLANFEATIMSLDL